MAEIVEPDGRQAREVGQSHAADPRGSRTPGWGRGKLTMASGRPVSLPRARSTSNAANAANADTVKWLIALGQHHP